MMEYNPTDFSLGVGDVLDLTDKRIIKALRAENGALKKMLADVAGELPDNDSRHAKIDALLT